MIGKKKEVTAHYFVQENKGKSGKGTVSVFRSFFF
jgi:hypothetical protein